jgi:hypothetical protein
MGFRFNANAYTSGVFIYRKFGRCALSPHHLAGPPAGIFSIETASKIRFLAFFLREKFNRHHLICWLKGRGWACQNPSGGLRGPASLLIQKLAARRAKAFAIQQ